MNSIQLISKINSRIEDLAILSHEVLKPNGELSNLEKEVIKKSCADLFELVLKLKTSNNLSEEQISIKENINNEVLSEKINFKEIINNETLTINKIEESTVAEQPIVLENIVNLPNAEVFVIEPENENNLTEEIIIQQETIELEKELGIVENEFEEATIAEQIAIENTQTTVLKTQPIVEENNNLQFDLSNAITIEKPTEIAQKPTPYFSISSTVIPKAEPSLNEKMAQKTEEFLFSEKVIEPPIESLKTAISLNKKIAFVNELFKENVVEYAKSIDKINSAADLNEALLIWSELKTAHNWNAENPLVKDLEKLIQRRFNNN